MFGTILISVCTAMQVYVFWRAASVPLIVRYVPAKALIAVGVLTWAVFFLGRTLGHEGTGRLSGVLEFFGMNWMGVLFLSFLSLLAVDIVTFFGLLAPRFSPVLRGGALGAALLLSAAALFQGLRPPVIVNHEVRLADLPAELDGRVLVAMSDMHLGCPARRAVAGEAGRSGQGLAARPGGFARRHLRRTRFPGGSMAGSAQAAFRSAGRLGRNRQPRVSRRKRSWPV